MFLVLTVWGCEGPSGVKKPGTGVEPPGKSSYPRIDAVFAENIVFPYGEQIDPDNFSVLYQLDAESEPVMLTPSTEQVPGFLINGSASPPLAGQYKEGEDGKYGEFKLIFTSAEDPSAKPYEYAIFVAAKNLDATHPGGTALQKLEVVRMPLQTVYDKGEPFNPYGLAVVAWHGSDTAGATIKEGGVPLLVSLFEVDDSLLLTAANGDAPKIKVSYTNNAADTVSTQFEVLLKIAEHEILSPSENHVTFTVNNLAPTGAFVTVGIKVDQDYELEEDGIVIELYNKQSELISTYSGVLSELAPATFTRKIAFIMPRNKIKISAKTLQIGSGLGQLSYKVGENEKPLPGFEAGANQLSYSLAIPSTVADGSTSLSIQAGPMTDRPAGSVTTIQMIGPGLSGSPSVTYNDSNTSNTPLEVNLGTLTAGESFDYTIQITYQITVGATGTTRDYHLRVMKFADEDAPQITYEHTGTYQVFVPPMAGYYRIEAWGGKGGHATPIVDPNIDGGPGGYAAGTIYLNPDSAHAKEKMPLYIYVGEAGKNWSSSQPYLPSAGGWNGGGAGGEGARGGSGGGGATSISTVGGPWNSLAVLGNRILVAGGGGGTGSGGKYSNQSNAVTPVVKGSIGGGIAGSPSITANNRKYGTNTSYKQDGTAWTLTSYSYTPGQAQPPADDPTFGFNGQGFGQGGTGLPGYQPNPTQGDGYNGKGGGGGGWWGGRVSLYYGFNEYGTHSAAGGGGGSNFIAGYQGCHAIDVITITDPDTGAFAIQSRNDSVYTASSGPGGRPVPGASPDLQGVVFSDPVMNEYHPAGTPEIAYEPVVGDTHLNNGHGRVIITYLGTELPGSSD
jgi:hypothetical protein